MSRSNPTTFWFCLVFVWFALVALILGIFLASFLCKPAFAQEGSGLSFSIGPEFDLTKGELNAFGSVGDWKTKTRVLNYSGTMQGISADFTWNPSNTVFTFGIAGALTAGDVHGKSSWNMDGNTLTVAYQQSVAVQLGLRAGVYVAPKDALVLSGGVVGKKMAVSARIDFDGDPQMWKQADIEGWGIAPTIGIGFEHRAPKLTYNIGLSCTQFKTSHGAGMHGMQVRAGLFARECNVAIRGTIKF